MPYSHKRSPEKQLEREQLRQQKRVANWLINGTKFTDNVKKESVATLTTEDVYSYISECVCEPDPRCAPQELDGTVLHNMRGEGLLDGNGFKI
jgi:hypothetical protein